MAASESYIIPGLKWGSAVQEARKKVKRHTQAGRGLIFLCAAPLCEIKDPLVQFIHPVSKFEMLLCPGHYRLVTQEMFELGYHVIMLSEVLKDCARRNGGSLRFASVGNTIRVPTGKVVVAHG